MAAESSGSLGQKAGRAVLLGPPGSGKGTQGNRLAAYWQVPHVASGNLLRQILQEEPDSELARAIRVIDQGRMVSDETAGAIVFRALDAPLAESGFVLDGYPRNVNQAQILEAHLRADGRRLDAVIGLVIVEEALIARLSGRLTCPNCGATYHIAAGPPTVPGVCDVCGHALVVREDDHPDRIRTRLRLYHEKTEPLMRFYRDCGLLREVDAVGPEEDVFARILSAMRR